MRHHSHIGESMSHELKIFDIDKTKLKITEVLKIIVANFLKQINLGKKHMLNGRHIV